MDRSIRDNLDKVLAVLGEWPEDPTSWEIPRWVSSTEGEAYFEAIGTCEDLAIFDRSLQILGNERSNLSLVSLRKAPIARGGILAGLLRRLGAHDG